MRVRMPHCDLIWEMSGEGLDILDKFITILWEKGYTFQKLADVYRMISK